MRPTTRAAATAVVTASLLLTGAATTQAAPTSKGTTTVAPSAVTASVLQGLTGPARLTSAGAVFGVVGRPSSGVVKHVGGLRVAELDPATAATSLTLSNFWVDTRSATVSALVNDSVRAVVFTVDPATGTLRFTTAASRAVTGGDALAGAVAGTATVALR